MTNWLLVPDVATLLIVLCAIGVTLSMRRVLAASQEWQPADRARVLANLALTPWVAGTAAMVLAFVPTMLFDIGWVRDWCLDRQVQGGGVCPMHLDTVGAGAGAWTVGLFAAAIAMSMAASGVTALRYMLSTQRQLDAVSVPWHCDELRVLRSDLAIAAATSWPWPRIYVSDSLLAQLEAAEVEALIAHERAHIVRGDARTLLVARIACLVLPPRTRQRLLESLRAAIEQACDEAAARATSPEAVASALVKFARASATMPARVPALMQSYGGGDIESRVARLLDQPASHEPPCRAIRAALLVLVLPGCWVLHELGEYLLTPLVR